MLFTVDRKGFQMKKTITILMTAILIVLLIPSTSLATERITSVYASNSIQDVVYRATQTETFDYYKSFEFDQISIVKESITPVYTVDILKYAETGIMTIEPDVCGVSPSAEDELYGNVYIAKLVTDAGDFAGNIQFYVEDGIAYGLLFTPSTALEQYFTNGTSRYMASCSYADHAKRIQNILDRSTFVPTSDVKYVTIDHVGSCFFVQNEAKHTIIPLGYENASAVHKTDYTLDTTELKEIADENLRLYNEYLLEKAEWEAEHPGETYEVMGITGTAPIITSCSEVDNIIDIAAYLNANTDESVSDNNNDTSEPSNVSERESEDHQNDATIEASSSTETISKEDTKLHDSENATSISDNIITSNVSGEENDDKSEIIVYCIIGAVIIGTFIIVVILKKRKTP